MSNTLYTPYLVKGSNEKKVDIQLADLININFSSISNWQDYTFHWYNLVSSFGGKGVYTLPESHYKNLLQIANQLAIIKKNSGLDFEITSGYRPLNPSSDHGRGAAADLQIASPTERKKLFDHIYKGAYTWKQLIWEDNKGGNIRGKYPDYPGVVHFSYLLGFNRKETLYSEKQGKPISLYTEGTSANPVPENLENTDDTQITENDSLVGSNAKTLEQSYENILNLEKGDVDEAWGQGYNYSKTGDPKRNNWISLKQYLIYLCTKFVPQGVYPFIELIPSATLSGQDWNRDGSQPTDNELDKASTLKYANSQAGQTASAKAKLRADLWSLDPFEESYIGLNEENGQFILSESGQNVYNKRLTGVRIYSQLVLSPEADDISPSKPGGIGFTELTINAGAQCDNGIALITMKLVDIQGNKFTDLNSPWSFIYDARPGGVGGDFYFRYGWQLRLPDPKNKEDLASVKFWDHPGWKLFDDDIRQFIAGQITSTKPYVTLTQSINELPSSDDSSKYALFDEGVELLSTDNSITISRTNLHPMNYVKLAILNPEIEVEPDGTITATLNFRTVGALAATIPLLYANNTKRVVAKSDGWMTLGDFIILLQTDFAQFEYTSLETTELKEIQGEFTNSYLGKLANSRISGRDFSNFVNVIGLDAGASIGNTHPDDVYIYIDDELKKELFDTSKQNSLQLVGWAREVLNANGMELNSVATGSGAGINSSWVITVGADFNKDNYKPTQREKKETTKYTNTLQLMKEEKDVFSFRFQGSLVENIKIEKTEASNALKIATDYAISDFLPQLNAEKTILTKNRDVTIADRRRNLNILYSQLQNVTVTSLCHPWIGPGCDFYIKGMGFWDGQYRVLKVSHKLVNLTHFISEISGARMIIPNDIEQEEDVMTLAAANGKTERTSPVQETYNAQQTSAPTTKDSSVLLNSTTTESVPVTQSVIEKPVQGYEDKWNKSNDIFYHNYGKGVKISEEKAIKIVKNLYNYKNQNDVIISIYKTFPSITTASYISDVFFQQYPELKKGYLPTTKKTITILPELFDSKILGIIKQIIYNLPDEKTS